MKSPIICLFAGVLIAVLLGATAAVRAQPALTPAQPAPGSSQDLGLKSPAAATGLAVLGTALGWGALVSARNEGTLLLGATGVLIGPSLGDIYAGDSSRVLVQSGVRTAGVVLVGLGVLAGISAQCEGTEDNCTPSNDDSGVALAFLGVSVVAFSSIYTIATTRFTVHEHNARKRRLSVQPTTIRATDGKTSLGLSLSGSF